MLTSVKPESGRPFFFAVQGWIGLLASLEPVEWSGFIRISTQQSMTVQVRALIRALANREKGTRQRVSRHHLSPIKGPSDQSSSRGGGWVGWDPFVLCV